MASRSNTACLLAECGDFEHESDTTITRSTGAKGAKLSAARLSASFGVQAGADAGGQCRRELDVLIVVLIDKVAGERLTALCPDACIYHAKCTSILHVLSRLCCM